MYVTSSLGANESGLGTDAFDFLRRSYRCVAPSSSIDVTRAVRLNRHYARATGWAPHRDDILRLLKLSPAADERAFAIAVAYWQCLRNLTVDGILGPNTWAAMKGAIRGAPTAPSVIPPPARPVPSGPPPSAPAGTPGQRVSQAVLDRIARYHALIEQVAREESFDANWIRGVIASESGGKADSGAGTGGYKGLMQAEKTVDQLDPATSLRSGVKKLKWFRSIVLNLLREQGGNPAALSPDDVIRMTMIAYNAGPGSVKQAMRYAGQAGEPQAWFLPPHFQRSLLWFGSYSIPTALRSLLTGPDKERVVAELSASARMTPVAFEARYRGRRGWKTRTIWKGLGRALSAEKKRWTKQPGLTLDEARRRAPLWVTGAAAFKHRNLQTWYVDRVIAYKRHFDRR